ncbi:MAG: hypothetical protein HXX16_18800 [Bacteroidales bacterium]|nr:hypothetical protein [Bacteroidales bacterium]
MNQTITLSFIASSSDLGKDLAEKLNEFLPLFFKKKNFKLNLQPFIFNGNQYDMMKAMLECDVVIFDASVEWNEISGYDSNYEAATTNPTTDDRILVVSRTKLPINFVPMHCNIPILGEEEKIEVNGVRQSKYHYTNDEIVKWVEKELTIMIADERIPKKPEMKLDVPPFDQLSTIGNKLTTQIEKNSLDSLEYMKMKNKGKRGAFISYRTRYFKEKLGGTDVMDLVQIIREKHDNPDYPVLIYGDGDISHEFLTEQRSWEIVGFMDRRIREVEEVWIFKSYVKNGVDPSTVSNYFDSWWTQGEILALMYIKAGSPHDLPKKIFLFDPYTRQIEEKSADFIPNLSDELHQEIARYYANADALESGNENMGYMRMLRSVGGILRRLAFYQMKRMQHKIFSDDSEIGKVLKENTYKNFIQSINSHVYDVSFTESRIVSCPNCRRKGVSIEDFKNEDFVKDFIKTNSEVPIEILDINARGFYSITGEKLEKIITNGKWSCPRCNKTFSVVYRENNNQYRWWPLRVGQRTGPDGVIIEKIPVYEIL